MPRPCEEGKYCKYETYDWSEYTECCAIDFDGTNCPYIKPWGKHKYEVDHKTKGDEQLGIKQIV